MAKLRNAVIGFRVIPGSSKAAVKVPQSKKEFVPPMVQVKQMLESIGTGGGLRVVQCMSPLQERQLQRVVKDHRPVQLGSGGQAEVYLAADSNNFEVAVKCFKWIRVRNLEALSWWVPEVACSMNFRGLPYCMESDAWTIQTKTIKGRAMCRLLITMTAMSTNLRSLVLESQQPIKGEAFVSLLLGAAMGVLSLHVRDTVHCDIKGENFFVSMEECDPGSPVPADAVAGCKCSVFIGDYGMCLQGIKDSANTRHGGSRLHRGVGDCELAGKSRDIWGFGQMLQELLQSRALDISGQLGEQLCSLLMALKHSDPTQRPTVHLLVTSLREILKELKEEAATAPQPCEALMATYEGVREEEAATAPHPCEAPMATSVGVREEAATAPQPCEALMATYEGVREEEAATAPKPFEGATDSLNHFLSTNNSPLHHALSTRSPLHHALSFPSTPKTSEQKPAGWCEEYGGPSHPLPTPSTPKTSEQKPAGRCEEYGGPSHPLPTPSTPKTLEQKPAGRCEEYGGPSHPLPTPSTPKISEQKPAGRCEEYGGPSHPLPTPSTPKTSEQKPGGRCEEASSLSPPPSAARLLCFSDPGDGLCAPRDSMHGYTLSEVTDPPKEERSMLSSGRQAVRTEDTDQPKEERSMLSNGGQPVRTEDTDQPKEERSMLSSGGQAVRTEDTDAPKEERSMLSSGGQAVRTEGTEAPKEERSMLSSGGQAVRTEDTDAPKEERSMLSSGGQAMPSGYGKDASAAEALPRGGAIDSPAVGIFWNEAFYKGMMAVGVEPVTTPGTGSPSHPHSNLVFFKEFDDDHGHCPVACAVAAACSTCAAVGRKVVCLARSLLLKW
eukprot:gene11546-34261_t